MADEKAASSLTKSAFLDAWEQVAPAILSEWDQVDEEALKETEGDLDKVILLVSERTGRTKTMGRRMLFEIYQVVTDQAPQARTAKRRILAEGVLPESMEAMLQELERRAGRIMRDLRGGLIRDTTQKLHDNLLVSLLVTLGVGFLFGLIAMGTGRSSRK